MDFLKRYYDKLALGLLLLGLVISMTILSSSLSKARDSVQIDDRGILDEIYGKPELSELDSAQFSAAVSELCDPRYIGTALTIQTCAGF